MKNLNEVRESIIEAAEKHFSLLGFEKTTLDDITGENGRSKTSVYYHFKNKHEIFKSVIEKEFNSVRDELQKVIDEGGCDRAECMKAYLRMRLESLRGQGAYRRFAASRFAYGDNPVSRVVSEARRAFDNWEKQYLELSISKGLEEGTVPASISPEVFSMTLINILKALEVQFFSSEDKTAIYDTYQGMIELMAR